MRERALHQATSGRGGATRKFFGYKLHAIGNTLGYICRFGMVSANEHDATVAKVRLDPEDDDLSSVIGDKAYGGLGISTPPKANAQAPGFWGDFFATARKSIEAIVSSLQRCRNLALQQLNSFWSLRASVCRKIAAHNLILFLFN